MHTKATLLLHMSYLLIFFSLILPITSDAGIFWSDDFENHLVPNWDTSACGSTPGPLDGCNPSISTDVAHSGTHSLKSHFIGDHTQVGTYLDRRVPQAGREIYLRFYYYTRNFIYDSVSATKQFYNISTAKGIDGIEMIWVNMWGSREMAAGPNTTQNVLCPNGTMDLACNLYPNLATIPLSDNRWYCIEYHLNAGTANTPDGLVELWVDGTKTLQYKIQLSFSNVGVWDIVRHYAQYGAGDRYIDDLAVSNTRIGCSSNGTANDTTTPPQTPTGLAVVK